MLCDFVSMGQCAGKSVGRSRKGKTLVKNIPKNSPLGEMLDNWDREDLDKTKIIEYCMEIWPKERISEGPDIGHGMGPRRSGFV